MVPNVKYYARSTSFYLRSLLGYAVFACVSRIAVQMARGASPTTDAALSAIAVAITASPRPQTSDARAFARTGACARARAAAQTAPRARRAARGALPSSGALTGAARIVVLGQRPRRLPRALLHLGLDQPSRRGLTSCHCSKEAFEKGAARGATRRP
jgi:hypothetical protein